MPCLHAISSLLEKDRRKRIGAAGFDTFTSNPFFQSIDFVALERKQIPPIFVPSTEKTNFDATYDLEELLLEEAPLEARARRQKPRAELKDDATDREIREDELHRMVETMFEPFDYTTTSYEGCVDFQTPLSNADCIVLAGLRLLRLLTGKRNVLKSPPPLHIVLTLVRPQPRPAVRRRWMLPVYRLLVPAPRVTQNTLLRPTRSRRRMFPEAKAHLRQIQHPSAVRYLRSVLVV